MDGQRNNPKGPQRKALEMMKAGAKRCPPIIIQTPENALKILQVKRFKGQVRVTQGQQMSHPNNIAQIVSNAVNIVSIVYNSSCANRCE